MKYIILEGKTSDDILPVLGPNDAVLFFDATDRKLKRQGGSPINGSVEPNWRKFTLTANDFLQTTGGTNTVISIGNNLIQPGSLITGVKVKHNTRFSAVTLTTACTLTISDESGTNHISSFDIFQAPGNTVGAYTLGTTSTTVIPNQVSATNVRARIVMSGVTADINILSGITQGSVDVYLKICNPLV